MAADLNKSSRSARGEASRRFSEVVSNGPTAIPLKEDVNAAMSSAFATDSLRFGQSSPQSGLQAQTVGDTRKPAAYTVPHSIMRASHTGDTTENAGGFNHRSNGATNGAGGGGAGGSSGGGEGGNRDERRRHLLDVASRPAWDPHSTVRASSTGGSTESAPPSEQAGRGGGFSDRPSDAAGNGGGGGGVSGGDGGDREERRSLLLDWALWPLWGTIDALKWAGGTVNEVAVAPVVRLASPLGLIESTLTAVASLTPQRARDLGRVVGNLGVNAAGLAQTTAGGALWQSWGRAAGSFSMAVSSPAGRQFLVDSATGFVKLAEALDTPESKNCIQQWAVMGARGLDALASRHSKIFVKDMAEVVVRLVELANSRKATVMAAEFTVNVAHALEVEHKAGLDRAEAEKAAAMPDNMYATSPRPSTAGVGSAADSNSPRVWVGGDGDDTGVRVPGGGPPDGGLEASREGAQSLEGLVRDARLERARHESFGAGRADVAVRVRHGAAGDGGNMHVVDDRSEGGETGDNDNDHDESSGRGELDARARPNADRGGGSGGGSVAATMAAATERRRRNRVVPTPIRQSDLTGKTPLSTLRPAGSALHSGALLASRRNMLDSSGADACHSAPPSPTGRSGFSLAANDTTAAGAAAVSALGESGPEGRRSRRRAFTETAADRDFSAAGVADGGVGGRGGEGIAESELEAIAADRSRSAPGGGEGGEGSAHPPVEYVRDGRAFLPRFTGRAFASILRGQPLGLGQQLEAPKDGSLDDAVARAARLSLQGSPSPSPRVLSVSAVEREAMDAVVGGPGEMASSGDSAESSAARKAAQGWKQLVFAVLLLFFAADGVLHRWNGVFGKKGKAKLRPSTAPHLPTAASRPVVAAFPGSTPSVGVCGDGTEDGSCEGDGSENLIRTTFLPPTCQDVVSGVTMAIWITPSGPCVTPAPGVDAKPRWFGGGGRGGEAGWAPGCSASFRPCSAAELPGDPGAGASPLEDGD